MISNYIFLLHYKIALLEVA